MYLFFFNRNTKTMKKNVAFENGLQIKQARPNFSWYYVFQGPSFCEAQRDNFLVFRGYAALTQTPLEKYLSSFAYLTHFSGVFPIPNFLLALSARAHSGTALWHQLWLGGKSQILMKSYTHTLSVWNRKHKALIKI